MALGGIRERVEDRFGQDFYRVMGVFALATVGVAILCDVTMWVIRLDEGYSPLANTISAAAAGPHAAILDAGMISVTLGLIALAVAFTLQSAAGWRAYVVRITLIVAALAILPVALYGSYEGGPPIAMVWHKIWTGVVFLTVPILLWLAPTAAPGAPAWEIWLGRAVAVTFLIMGPFFPRIPEGWNGAYERLLALIALGAVATASWQLLRRPAEADGNRPD